MDFIEGNFKEVPCDVYFFKSWSTYRHPVTPEEAVTLEQAFMSKSFYRAWMCNKEHEKLFVFFEGIKNSVVESEKRRPVKDNNLHVYEFVSESNDVGEELSPKSILTLNEFWVAFPDTTTNKLFKVKQEKTLSYEYLYSKQGELTKVVITNPEGKVTKLDY